MLQNIALVKHIEKLLFPENKKNRFSLKSYWNFFYQKLINLKCDKKNKLPAVCAIILSYQIPLIVSLNKWKLALKQFSYLFKYVY